MFTSPASKQWVGVGSISRLVPHGSVQFDSYSWILLARLPREAIAAKVLGIPAGGRSNALRVCRRGSTCRQIG